MANTLCFCFRLAEMIPGGSPQAPSSHAPNHPGVFAKARTQPQETPAAQFTTDFEVDEATPDALVEALRSVRRAQRKRKKERRQVAKAAKAEAAQLTASDGRDGPALGRQAPNTIALQVASPQPAEGVQLSGPADTASQRSGSPVATLRSASPARSYASTLRSRHTNDGHSQGDIAAASGAAMPPASPHARPPGRSMGRR